MKILTYPNEIVERGLYDKYEYYVLSKEIDRKKHLEENIEFEISEKDALVIGLLKCVETDNLIHKFNDYIDNFMANKSSRIEDTYKVKKKILIQSTIDFKLKFPDYWQPKPNYAAAKIDLFVYIDEMIIKFENLPTEEIKEKTGTFEYVNCNSIKKTLKYHN